MIEISRVLLELDGSNATEIMGEPDDKKLHSCMTLFSTIAPEVDVFENVLEKYFEGKKDQRTLEILQEMDH